MWFNELKEVIGTDNPKGVEAVRVENVNTGEITEIACKGVFIAIGHSPASELVNEQLDPQWWLCKSQAGSTRTSIDGIFAAGDLTDHIYRQAITSAGMGCMVALRCRKVLAEQE